MSVETFAIANVCSLFVGVEGVIDMEIGWKKCGMFA